MSNQLHTLFEVKKLTSRYLKDLRVSLLYYRLTWFFILKLLEQSSAHKPYVILSNLLGSEPSFEHKPLGMSYFPKPVEIRNLFLFILTFEETF